MEKLERKIMSVILVIVVILALFLGLIDFISDFMWFKEMGYTAVFFKQLVTQLTVGVPTFIVVTGLVMLYLHHFSLRQRKSLELVSVLSLNCTVCIETPISGCLYSQLYQLRSLRSLL